jgi:hypothetical protein
MSPHQLAPALAGLVVVQVAEAKELEGESNLEVLEVAFLKFNRFRRKTHLQSLTI